MTRRSFHWATLCGVLGLLVALSASARGEPGVSFENLPPGWKVVSNVRIPAAQVAAIAGRYHVTANGLSNTILEFDGRKIQVNVLDLAGPDDAAKIYRVFLRLHGGSRDYVLRHGNRVVEFVGRDIEIVRRAHYALGLTPKTVTYRVKFDAAPLEEADAMEWNHLFDLFLALDKSPDDAKLIRQTKALAGKFRFGEALVLRAAGQGSAKNEYAFEPAPVSSKRVEGGAATRYEFGKLPTRAGVPYVSVTATVTSTAFARVPAAGKPDKALLAATRFWPVHDKGIAKLAAKITAGTTTDEGKVQALLDWLFPGRHIRFGGSVTGSRWGVKATLKQGFGHCWDFSDVFVTLSRAAGVPARQVAGWLHGVSGHIWAEVLVDGKSWQQVDPTAGMACTTEYVPLVVSDDGRMPLLYLSMPEITILPAGASGKRPR